MKDIIRISNAVPKLKVADTSFNTNEIICNIKKARDDGSSIVLFPELSVTGYTCGDLFFQSALISASGEGIKKITEETKNIDIISVVGAPLLIDGLLYNCAFVIACGKILGIIPKTYLPDNNEYSEKRWFVGATELATPEINASVFGLDDYNIPIGSLVFTLADGHRFGVEVCEDLWSPIPPSTNLALNGSELIFNLSASNDIVGKREYRKNLVASQSDKCLCAYSFVSSGTDESTTDLVFSGHSIVANAGSIVSESTLSDTSDYILTTDVDLGKVGADRKKLSSFKDTASILATPVREVKIYGIKANSDGGKLKVSPTPFFPCTEAFDIQVNGLKRRLEVIGACPVIGVSGGLDSTLALLVCVEAVRRMNKPLSTVHGITMPGFGTSGRTYDNSIKLMKLLGVTVKEISIKEACLKHFEDIGHSPDNHDLTYENAQARERTQVLMDYAGKVGGLVVGTGDLSELALGWCTYNADHMSMYGVNSGVPKSVIRQILKEISKDEYYKNVREILDDVINTPISPELLPPDEKGSISQVTEDIVGPYELHDFFIYYNLRYGYEPVKIYELAKIAFAGEYDCETIKKWLKNFYKRFFTQQFKRNCQPDGVKVFDIGISPRGDLRMPSDASSNIWLEEIDKL